MPRYSGRGWPSMAFACLAVAGLLAGTTVGPAKATAASAPGHDLTGPGKVIALTFDDGPDRAVTPVVLDILKRHRAHAVFCMVGSRAEAQPDLVRRIVAEGHVLCDHTQHHSNLTRVSPQEMRRQVATGRASLVTAAPDAPVPWFRAPYAYWSSASTSYARRLGMWSLGWTVDTRDWSKPGVAAIQKSIESATDGSIVILHDGLRGTGMPTALDRALTRLHARGYRFEPPTTGRHINLPRYALP